MAGSVSLEQKLSLPLLLIGILMLVVTLAETSWFTYDIGGQTVQMGLWKICGEQGGDDDDCRSLQGSPDWITGPELLECMSLSCAIGASALSFRLLFHKTKLGCVLTAITTSLTGLLGLTGALVFYGQRQSQWHPAWCFAVNITGDVFILVSSLLLYLHLYLWARRNYNRL